MTSRAFAIFALLLPALTALAAPPGMRIDVEVGFGGAYRAGAWTPIFATIQAREPRAILLRLRVPQDSINLMQIDQAVSVNAGAQTFALFAPPQADLSYATVEAIDPRSGVTIADCPLDRGPPPTPRLVDSDDTLIGYAGSGAGVSLGDRGVRELAVGAIAPARLPGVAIGYDSLDLLILGAADLARIAPETQRAIADWVYAGGKLLYWPASAPLPPESPLVALLPADVGDNAVHELDPATLDRFALPQRFARLPVRTLTPRAGAKEIDALAIAGAGYVIDRGLGKVGALSFGPSLLGFGNDDARATFWRRVLLPLLGEGQLATRTAGERFSSDRLQTRVAAVTAIEALGDIPGVGEFGFSYVLIVLLGMMIVVGPLDWFVLKKLGRQPWTIYTTTGWIVLITLGAVYIGRLMRSGDLHLRTAEVVEQVGGNVVDRQHLAVVYSPRTTAYALATPEGSWWRPASIETYYRGRRSERLLSDIPFRQAERSTRPMPLTIRVWSLAFLQGEEIAQAPPWIETDLAIRDFSGEKCIVGRITNRTDHALKNVAFLSRGKWRLLAAKLEPGESLDVNAAVNSAQGLAFDEQPVSRMFLLSARANAVYAGLLTSTLEPTDKALLVAQSAWDETATATPVHLREQRPIHRHVRALRALVPLKQGDQPQ